MASRELHTFCRNHESALWLLLICLVATALRFAGLDFQSFWYDELFSAYYSNPGHTLETVKQLTLADVHPPLYQIIVWYSFKAFGYNEWAGRLPSALAGAACIPVIYLLGKELFSRRVGLYAAALATPNFYLLYFSQEARSYAFLYFLCCLSFLFFLRCLQARHWLNVAGYVLATVALLYTHYFGFLLVLAQGLLLLVCAWGWRPIGGGVVARALVALVAVSIAIMPMLADMFTHAGVDDFWIQQPSGWFLVQYFIGYFDQLWLAAAVGALVLFAVTWGLWRPAPLQQAAWIRFAVIALLVWVLIGVLLPWARGLYAQPVITDRNTIMVLPPLLLLAAYGLSRVPFLALQRFIGGALLLASFAHLFIGADYYGRVTKNQYRTMAANLIEHSYGLPIYTLKFNDTKYNVYFEQLGSPIRAVDASVLEEKLATGQAEPLFWLADGHMRRLQTDIEERFNLTIAAKYTAKGVVAELLLNPKTSRAVELEPALLSAADGNWLSVGSLQWPGEPDLLLLALNREAQDDPLRRVQLDILDSSGHVLESHVTRLGALPSVLLVDPDLAAGDEVRLLLRLPEGEPRPSVWLISSASQGPE